MLRGGCRLPGQDAPTHLYQ